jgi:molybdate transport system regulatory protein
MGFTVMLFHSYRSQPYKNYATIIADQMLTSKKQKPSGKIWIEHDGKPLLGKGGAEILEQIGKEESISKAAKNLNMSYRYVWSYLQKIEKTLGEPIVETFRGGKSGGGGARLTRLGQSLLNEYKFLERYLGEFLSQEKYWEVAKLKISARNRLKGKVVAVEKNGLMAKIKVEITVPASVTALISKEAAEDLSIKVGDQVEAVVKATEVMIAK